ncbi:MAG: type II toxin-antitoxin system HicA family toxin [Dehalococcoidia bacterium]|nr:type II toxin-antitoxin system HicA family toxin [Dehalococcoidia bacterium]
MPTAREAVRVARRLGWAERRTSGSHVIFNHMDRPTALLIIPMHRGDLPEGTYQRILKTLGIGDREFRSLA